MDNYLGRVPDKTRIVFGSFSYIEREAVIPGPSAVSLRTIEPLNPESI